MASNNDRRNLIESYLVLKVYTRTRTGIIPLLYRELEAKLRLWEIRGYSKPLASTTKLFQ